MVDACDPVPFKSVFFKVMLLALFKYDAGTLLPFVLVLKLCVLFFAAIGIFHIMNHCKNILLIFILCDDFNRVDFFITLLCNVARFLGHCSLHWVKTFLKVTRP